MFVIFILICLYKSSSFWVPDRPLEHHSLLRFNSHYLFPWCFQMARIMIILEVEVTFMVDLLTGHVVLMLQDIRPLFYLVI